MKTGLCFTIFIDHAQMCSQLAISIPPEYYSLVFWQYRSGAMTAGSKIPEGKSRRLPKTTTPVECCCHASTKFHSPQVAGSQQQLNI